MTYRGVNRKRLAWLIGHGLSQEELRKFFKQRRAPLLLAGVKVQVAPNSSEDSINYIARFDERANGIFAAWLNDLEVESADIYAGQVLPYVKAIETLGLRLPAPETKKIARLGLKELYAEVPSDEWIDFLKTEIQEGVAPPKPQVEPASVKQKPIEPQDVEAVTDWLLGIRTVEQLPKSPWTEPIALFEAIKTGSLEAIEPQLLTEKSLKSLASEHARLVAATAKSKNSGFHVADPDPAYFEEHENYLSKDIVAIYSSGTGPYFLDVVAFLGEDGVFTLDGTDMRRALPDEGKLILHVDARLGAPLAGVAETYHAERYPTSRPIKCRAVRHGRRLSEVTYVPHSSSDRDAVRKWISETSHTAHAGRAPRIYVLSDGLSIRAKQESRPSVGASTSDWTFDCWTTLQGVHLAGRAYVVEPLPVPDGSYECEPPVAIARRYLRSLSTTKGAKYTKQQLTDIATYLVDEDVSLTEHFRSRLLGNVQSLQATDEHYDEIIQELMKSESVRRDIESRIQDAVRATSHATKAEQDRLANLRRERQSIEAGIKGLKAEASRRSREIDAAVKKAFKHAAEHELETFGQLALLKALLGSSTSAPEAQSSNSDPLPVVEYTEAGGATISQLLLLLGYESHVSSLIDKTVRCAKETGTPIILEGIGANRLARKFASAVSSARAGVIDIPVGTYTAEATRQAIESGADVIAYTSANLSCPTGYAQPVLAGTVDRVLDPQLSVTILAIFSAATGPMALPWPAELEAVALKIQLDPAGLKAAQIDVKLTPVQQKLWARLERTAEDLEMTGSELEIMKAMFGVITASGELGG